MMGLSYGEEIMIVGRTMWTQCTSVTDGQTDGRTDRQTDGQNYDHKVTKTVQCIASHGKNRQNRQFVPTPVSEIALAWGDPYRIS